MCQYLTLVLSVQNFLVDQLKIFVPRGTEFLSESVENFRSPGNENFPGNQSENFVPRGTKFLSKSVENFCSPGNEISQ